MSSLVQLNDESASNGTEEESTSISKAVILAETIRHKVHEQETLYKLEQAKMQINFSSLGYNGATDRCKLCCESFSMFFRWHYSCVTCNLSMCKSCSSPTENFAKHTWRKKKRICDQCFKLLSIQVLKKALEDIERNMPVSKEEQGKNDKILLNFLNFVTEGEECSGSRDSDANKFVKSEEEATRENLVREILASRRRQGSLDVHETTCEYLAQIQGFRQSRDHMNEIAKDVLPHDFMDQYPAIKPSAPLLQKDCYSLEDVYEKARNVYEKFRSFMLDEIAPSANLDPNKVAMYNGEPLMLTAEKAFTTITIAPLKGIKRAREKVINEYGGNAARLVDVIRSSIVVESEDELNSVAKFLQSSPKCKILRLKNRFKKPNWNGYRDALYNIEVDGFICEVQLHLTHIVRFKEENHVYYEYFRTFFSGSVESCKAKMDLLEEVVDTKQAGGDIGRRLRTLLKCDDIALLISISKLGRVIGDHNLRIHALSRIVMLSSDQEINEQHQLEDIVLANRYNFLSTISYVRAMAGCYSDMGNHERAIALYESVIARLKLVVERFQDETLVTNAQENISQTENDLAICYGQCGMHNKELLKINSAYNNLRKQEGEKSPNTLAALHNLGLHYKKTGNLEKASTLYQRALQSRIEVLGEKHYDTLITMSNLGLCYMNMMKIDKAVKFLEKTLKLRRETLGPTNVDTLDSMHNLSTVLLMSGQPSKAMELEQEAYNGYLLVLGENHEYTMESKITLQLLNQMQTN
eukprot:g2170.t1